MGIRVGCTGWAYDDWRGGFYPENARPAEYLERYGQVFDFTEVDSSFYGPPKAATTQKWAEATPPGFVFSLKVPGEITHEKRLRGADKDLGEFFEGIRPLQVAEKLGPLVLQLPPSFVASQDRSALEAFLDAWPRHLRLAVEFRDPSWWTASTYDLLRSHRACLVWALTQYGDVPGVETADFVYARFVGDRQLTRFDKVQRDLTPLIEQWRPRILSRDEPRDAYLVVNNHFMGFAPQTVRIALRVLGLPDVDLQNARRRRHQAGLGEF